MWSMISTDRPLLLLLLLGVAMKKDIPYYDVINDMVMREVETGEIGKV